MKKTKIALAVAAASIISAPAFATNGDELIGLGAQSRALGGTGVAAFYGAENQLINPAMLGKAKGSEFLIGGTIFKPNVKATSDIANPGTDSSETSSANMSVIPEVSMATRINNNLVFGLGMYGTAGMGVDYRDNNGLFNATSNLQLMKFVPTLAYNSGSFGVGFSPVLQYGALDINYNDSNNNYKGNGVSTDLGTGFDVGAYYDVSEALTVALSYQSAINMTYDNQITDAADGFGIGPGGLKTITSDDLEQPAQIKAGVAYSMENWMFTADAKQIKWGDAKGYKDFNWDNQTVYGIGAKYSGSDYWAGFGYNYGKDPIDVLPEGSTGATPGAGGMTGYSNQAVNMFNNHFFPGIVEQHYTLGAGYSLNKTMTIEGAVVYAPQVTKTIKTGVISSYMGTSGSSTADAGTTHEVKHSQIGYTISLRMNF